MKSLAILLLVASAMQAQKAGADSDVESILQVKRIYVSQLTGGVQADALRELIIAGLNSTKLFILTDNPDRADGILKGAADDTTFTDTFDTNASASSHENINSTKGGNIYTRATGIGIGNGGSDDDSHHIKERKHEAYATVRLCNKDGDVLWSTTQESPGAKFRGASADVAARIAKQITADYEKERRNMQNGDPAKASVPPISVK